MDQPTISLREYLDVQFGQQREALMRIEGNLREVSGRIDALAEDHGQLDRTVASQDGRLRVLEAEARDAKEWRRRIVIVGIPLAFAVVAYLLTALIETFARLTP